MKLAVHDWAALDDGQRAALLARPGGGISEAVRERARAILDDVRQGGAPSAARWHAELGGGALDGVLWPLEAVQAQAERLDPEVRAAIDAAYRNLQTFHAGGLPRDWARETLPGVRCETRHVPVGAVGLYVPGGSAVLPSTALMLGVPAQLAGCPVRVLASPAAPGGTLSPAVCYAALRCGVTHVLRVGGAQAVGLLAYGDAAAGVPAVDKIFGPGNAFVTAAKLEVAAQGVAIDMPAGPSELLVIADAAARPAFVAADLLSQAEHGPDSQVLLVSDSAGLLAAVQGEVARQLAELPRREVAQAALEKSRLILVPDLAAALAVSEAYAPEHLSVQVRAEAEDALLSGVRRAGSVFVGPFSPEAAGDYASGPSHVLPTAGAAGAYSGLSASDFLRHLTVQRVSEDGLRRLAPTVTTLAAEEGLEAHRRAVTVRLDTPPPQPTLFIDRDGTLIDEPLPSRQIDSLEKLRLLPGVVPALRELRERYRLVMVSNQDGLGTASFPQADFDLPQARLLELLASQGVHFDAVYVCPHREEDGCGCRKPRTGLLEGEIAQGRFTPDSWVIGDRQTDLDLAANLGLGGLRYGPELGWDDIAERLLRPPRRAALERTTRETQIRIELDLDAPGPRHMETGLGFFDHMLDQIATHGGFALNLHARGDLHIDEHHTVEDCGIALGQALKEALGDKRGVARFAHVHLPMDECAAACLLDLSGRPWLEFSASFSRPAVGGLDTSLVEHFFGSLATHLGATVHLSVGDGNAHHQVESLFKAFGRALRGAVARQGHELPSSKGTL